MTASRCSRNAVQGHPCFGGDHQRNGRIHLAVAPRCNIKCGYCTRRHDCVNESRPGVTSRIQTPAEALETVRSVLAHPEVGPLIRVVGIAGPGDPLANEETFETFRLIGREFPWLIRCMSTNGLLLPEQIGLLEDIGLTSLTVTINALDPAIAGAVYTFIRYRGRIYRGTEAGGIIIANQLEGVRRAAACGMTVKINTVLIPGINDGQIPLIADKVRELGAFVMNIMPLIPQAEFADREPPSPETLERIRRENEQSIGQFRHCRQCRADAVGLIGQATLTASGADPRERWPGFGIVPEE